jgi:hypothetical protein
MPANLKAALATLKQRDGVAASEAIRRGLVAFLKQRGIAVKAKKGGTRTPRRRPK